MISTQKIILMAILINVMIGIVLSLDKDINNPDFTTIDELTSSIDTEQENTNSETGIWGEVKAKAGQVFESTIINVIKWGAGLYNIFKLGFNPWSISTEDYNTEIEKLIVRIIQLIRAMTIGLLILEIYSYFKNKKAT